jgi:hypothetical protein
MAMSVMGLLAAAFLGAGCVTPAPKAPDTEALRTLKRMSEALAAATSFSFEALTATDQPDEDGRAVRVARRGRILVARPDRMVATVKGDDGERTLWYDGRTLSLLEKDVREYATVAAPSGIDQLLDYAMYEHGLSVPVADLLFSDPYAVLTEAVLTDVHLGTERIGPHETEHLLFTQENVDWEIWIDAGDVPVPRKIVITRKLEPGSPQFVALLGAWDLAAKPGADAFEFRVPQGATPVTMRELLGME